MFDCEATASHQGDHHALCDAAIGVQKPFVDAREVVNGSLSLVFGRLKRGVSDRPRFSSAYFANRDRRHSRTRAAFDSRGVSMSDSP